MYWIKYTLETETQDYPVFEYFDFKRNFKGQEDLVIHSFVANDFSHFIDYYMKYVRLSKQD